MRLQLQLLLLLACVPSVAAAVDAAAPRVTLWAWTRSEDLSFVPPDSFDVAFLAGEILIRPGRVIARPRVRPIRLPSGVTRIAVVYVDVAQRVHARMSDADIDALAQLVRAMPLVRDADRLQLNFEAATSRVPDWQRLVRALRARMPATQTLEATVLASWCMDAAFVSPAQVRLVPMMLRLGRIDPALQAVLRGDSAFPAVDCRGSIGVALDEFDLVDRETLNAATTIYVFSGAPWTPARLKALQAWRATAFVRASSLR